MHNIAQSIASLRLSFKNECFFWRIDRRTEGCDSDHGRVRVHESARLGLLVRASVLTRICDAGTISPATTRSAGDRECRWAGLCFGQRKSQVNRSGEGKNRDHGPQKLRNS